MIKLLLKAKGFSLGKKVYTLILLFLISSFGYSQITVIHTASFESDLDGWTDGGFDAIRDPFAARAYDGTYSLRIRDNTGNNSSFISPTFNISTYNKVDFSFFFYPVSMENAENFFIEYRDTSSSSWTVIGDFRAGNINFTTHTGDFQRGFPNRFYAKTVTINSDTHTFSPTAQFRVRCDASNNFDLIYLDMITIEGTTYNSITEAPGGVTNGLELWLKADYVDGVGVGTDNTDINEWVDSGKGHNARTIVSAQAPLYKNNITDNINFNPVIDFENSSVASNPDMQYLGTYAGSRDELKGTGGFYSHDMFMVVIPDQVITTGLIPLDTFCSTDPTGTTYAEDVTGFGYGSYTNRLSNELLTYCIGTTTGPGNGYGRADTGASGIDFNQVGIVNFRHNNANTSEELYFNANDVGDTEIDAPDFSNLSNERFWLGRSQKWSGSFGGRIAEVITYSSRKTDGSLTQERNRIQSYLAIKYGITLGVNGTSQDYVDSAGSVIWDQSVNSGYNYHIAGIGRDDDAELNQKQSKTINTADDITMGLTDITATNSANANTFASDRNFIVWGNDQGSLAAQPAVVVNMSSGILPALSLASDVEFTSVGRTWKVVESGTVGATKVSIPEIMLSATLTPPGAYLMFISNTPTFSPTSEYRIMTLNGSDLETSYNFNGTKYITFGYAPERTFVRSIYFDGATDYLDSGDVLDLTSSSFSMSAWVKRDASATGDIVSKRDIPYTEGYSMLIEGGQRARMIWRNGGANQIITSSEVIPANVWHHIAVTYDGTNARMYIDGVLDVTTPLSPPDINTTQHFLIGAANHIARTRFFQGNIDEVRVWDVALTQDQLKYIMNQEIEDNGNVAGSYFTSIGVTPTKEDVVPWSNLQAYYPMSTYTYTNAKDESDNGYTAALVDLTTVDHQTAPLPYLSSGTTTGWDTDTTWVNGDVQTIPGAISIVDNTKTVDGNIVQIDHDVSMDNSDVLIIPAGKNDNRTLLALIVNSNELTIEGNIGTGNGITVTHYLELDGVIDLEGESQLIQTNQSDLATSSSGYIEKDQQGTANAFTYNYWAAPVSLIGAGTNNTAFTIGDILRDGTSPESPVTLDFEAGTTLGSASAYYADGAVSNPRKIAKRWLWTYNNSGNDYANWDWLGSTYDLNVTDGYTMKGISGASAIGTDQNYVFLGKPNNVLNGGTEIVHTTFAAPADPLYPDISLTGNPFPSALDANQFITDNMASTNGQLYFWEHWGGGDHLWKNYQGGYAVRTIVTGTPAVSHPDIDQTGSGSKTPGQYIAVGQGFYVISSDVGGNVVFNNGQRTFQKEGASSTFFKQSGKSNKSSNIEEGDGKMIIRVGFESPKGFHRQVAVAFEIEGATDGFDKGYDGRSGDFLSNDAFFIQDDKYYVIQAFGDFKKEREIPISIFIDADNDNGIQKFMIDKLENISDNVEIYIKDNVSGETFDIKNQNYEVNLPTGEHKTRFSLVFQPRLLRSDEIAEIKEGFIIYVNNNLSEINIKKIADIAITKAVLVNSLGQTISIWSSGLENRDTVLPVNVSTGVYILSVETESGTIIKKLLIE
ncbi:MAG: LamG domain-containing protein [Flavobacteriaceae bacterium]|nr:LamG domain-containing protein [Flavobacteriaceae bacterium]